MQTMNKPQKPNVARPVHSPSAFTLGAFVTLVVRGTPPGGTHIMQPRLDEAGVSFGGVPSSGRSGLMSLLGLSEGFPPVAGYAEHLEVFVGVVVVVAGVVPVVDFESGAGWVVVAAVLAGVVVAVEDATSGEGLDVSCVGPSHGALLLCGGCRRGCTCVE